MQTFLPYPDFKKTAAVLDWRRLGNQRLEGLIILRTLEQGGGWRHHQAVKMWRGHEDALRQYIDAMIEEWTRRGYKNSIARYDVTTKEISYPRWLGDEALHASHRAALLAKDYAHYSQFGWREAPGINYVWPEA